MQPSPFQIHLEVRDDELDQFGVVNHARYLNYFEHARHQFLRRQGIDPAAFAAQGKALAVSEIRCCYRSPLRSGQAFLVTVAVERIKGARVYISQKMMRIERTQHIDVAEAAVVAVFLDAYYRPLRINDALRAQLEA